jgi:hypothetical protein
VNCLPEAPLGVNPRDFRGLVGHNVASIAECIIERAISWPERTLDAARAALEERGGALTGDLESGEILAKTPVGDVVGRSAIADGLLTIQIVRKPRLTPSGLVRSVVSHVFASLEP